MAVEWRHLIFGDADSADFGIYISGDGVYNAPERAVEFVDVPGRNGAIALDQGRYNNITITYPAGTFAKTQEEFRENLSAFRNAILSQRGYQRLEDTYHPDEYRMGIFTAGLEVSPVNYNLAGEFELTFNCKPQRWLTVGDIPIPVESGDVLLNPTEFDSGPLVKITGYGTVEFNEYEIEVTNDPLGEVVLLDEIKFNSGEYATSPYVINVAFGTSQLIPGDTIKLKGSPAGYGSASFWFDYANTETAYTLEDVAITSTGTDKGSIISSGADSGNNQYFAQVAAAIYYVNDITFIYGTPSTKALSETLTFTLSGVAQSYTLSCAITYDGDDTLTFALSAVKNSGTYSGELNLFMTFSSYYPLTADSTMPAWGTVYIDCDIGEAYKFSNGDLIDLNSKITLGSDLPSLAPGLNKIVFDNTITELLITPRWWRI